MQVKSFLIEYSSKKLKELRERKGASQEEIAEELTKLKIEREKILFEKQIIKKIDNQPITRQTVSKYETGKITMNQDVLFDLAEIFNVPIDYFFPSKEHTIEIKDSETGQSIKLFPDKPWEEYTKEEQEEYIAGAMDALYEYKRKLKDKN